MTIELHRRRGESPESLMRRFTRRVQASGLMLEVRKRRVHLPTSSHLGEKRSALWRMYLANQRAYLRRVGLIEEHPKAKAARTK